MRDAKKATNRDPASQRKIRKSLLILNLFKVHIVLAECGKADDWQNHIPPSSSPLLCQKRGSRGKGRYEEREHCVLALLEQYYCPNASLTPLLWWTFLCTGQK